MSCNEPNKNENARGIDVSRWQGDIDWTRVAAAGITHAIAKMTEGGDYTDAKFVTNFQGMQANGLKAGVYHYFRALSSAPCEQLTNIKGRLAEVAFNASPQCLKPGAQRVKAGSGGNTAARARLTVSRGR